MKEGKKNPLSFLRLVIFTQKHIEIKQQKKLGLIVSGRVGNNHNDFSKKLDNNYLNNILNARS